MRIGYSVLIPAILALAACGPDTAGPDATHTTGTTKEHARPRVVRTSPAPQRTNVPLNAVIKVVFSAPMMLESVVDGVRLLQGGTVVPAAVVAGDASGLIFDVQPPAALKPAVSYQLMIAASVKDVNGTSMAEDVSIFFTTASSSAQTGSLRVVVETVGESIDPDGYVVQAWREDPVAEPPLEGTVSVDDTLLLPGQVPGSYHVYLMGVPDHCLVDDNAMRQVPIAAGITTTEHFMVRCAGSGGGDPVGTGTVRVHMYALDTIPGLRLVVRQGCDTDPFCPRGFVSWTEPAVFHGVPAGVQGFALENTDGCTTALPLSFIFIDVRADETVDISFPVICSSG